ncbi:hypothetical protein ELI02_25580 (plasmid) [Rhizobium leguminosarum]|uniref:hypothetical protein n=1 Tax=Rhizobium leguminosarum TaxID=384 RepID=UPI001031036D|nr:hypothetical protein [Rhizobium leguminosarum]TAX48510.1 hypothetical protein ELI02_25580 [Rhizobium leguminosarum]TAX48544.1 hypothetical protein ELI01_25020 [Rhizobium leguminosarum]TAX86506.1 hypothetical protein ELH95_32060 [Rhizobium leguminosarum]
MPRKISIVGNASFGCREAAIIDDCDFVVRFNDCWSVGKGGCRTDVVAATIPAGRQLSMVRERSWHEKPAVASASEIWCVRDAMKFVELKTKLDPALDDFCDDYTGELAMFAAETEKVFKVIPRIHHDRIDRSCPMEWCSFGARRAFRTEPGMDQLAAGRLMSGSSLIVAIVSSVM